jgi:hypothetical protein
MGYPSYLNKFFNQVKLVIAHYGIVHNNDITYFSREGYMWTYYITASFGRIYIHVDTQMMNGTIEFDRLFKSVEHCIEYEYFVINHPPFKKQFEAFLKDKEIFNAMVTDHFVDDPLIRTYGSLLEMLDVSLVLTVSADNEVVDEDSFIIRYNKSMSWTKIRIFDRTYHIVFEKTYDFNYENSNLVYDGDYKELHQAITEAYHLNELDFPFTGFKDLAQLTLMKIY